MTTPIVVLTDRADEIARLVRALAEVDDGTLPPHVAVGGLAVMVRLAQAHRVTADIDQALRSEGRAEAAELIVARGTGARVAANGVVLADGTAVDLIAIGQFEESDLPDGLVERAFVLAHDYAIASAQPLTLQARRGRSVIAEATTPFATPAALVACKCAAVNGRRGAGAATKRASDLLDLSRLLSTHDVVAALSVAPYGLAGVVAELLTRTLVDGADRAARDVRAMGPAAYGIDADALDSLGSRVSAALRT